MLIYLSNPSGKGDLLSTWEIPANGNGVIQPDDHVASSTRYFLQRSDQRFVVFNSQNARLSRFRNLQLLNLRLLKYRSEASSKGFRNDVEFYMRSSNQILISTFIRAKLALLPARC